MADLPEGLVTFLFTDVEGSTRLWEEAPDSMMEALQQHDAVIDAAAVANNGVLVRPRGEGDSRFVVFSNAIDAVIAGGDVQRGLAEAEWSTPEPIVVRMALHTGATDRQGGDYYGSAVNRAARLRGVAHGGQTLISRATCELVRDHLPPGMTIRDLGEHSLRDLTRPEHVFQVDVEGLDRSFPPLASLNAVPNNLPVQLTDFVGREDELEEAKRIIVDNRLLTILAPGGAGKTRLGIQAAADLAADFPEGVFFVDLAPLTDPDDIAQAIAESTGMALATDDDVRNQLLAYLARLHMLLILDNFEHLIDGAGLVGEILRAAPEVKIVATSRAKLNVTGETVLGLAGLEASWDGVQLFVEAATRADAGFALDPEQTDGVFAILRLVDGMPLGIELAAAWVDVLSIAEIATEIEKSLDFLATETTDAPQRQRSMRAVFDYSWGLLSEAERSQFAALSVFRGGFAREAAEEVAGASLRSLSNLASKSLIAADRVSGRYAVHELLRQYAQEELERDAESAEERIAAHTEFYARSAAQATDLFWGAALNQPEAIRSIEADVDNMRTALRRALLTHDAEQATVLSFALIYLYEIYGWVKPGLEMAVEVKDAFSFEGADGPAEQLRAAATVLEAKFLTNLGHVYEAAPMARAALDDLQRGGTPLLLVAALESLAEISVYQGDYEAVVALSDQAIEVATEGGIEVWAAGMLNYKAGAYMQLGDIETAERVLREGDEKLTALDEKFMRAWNLEMQAGIALMSGRVEDSIEVRNRQIQLSRDIRYRRPEALGLLGLGQAYLAAGDPAAAYEALLQAMGIFDQMGLIVEVATVLLTVAQAREALDRPDQAVANLSSIYSDPVSEQLIVFQPTSIADAAAGHLAGLETELDAEAFTAAHARGSATPLAVMVKELLRET